MKESLRETMNALRKRQADDENIVRFSLPLLLHMGLNIPSALAKKLSSINSSTSKRQRRNGRGVFKNLRNRSVNSRKFWNHLSRPRTKKHLMLSWCVQCKPRDDLPLRAPAGQCTYETSEAQGRVVRVGLSEAARPCR